MTITHWIWAILIKYFQESLLHIIFWRLMNSEKSSSPLVIKILIKYLFKEEDILDLLEQCEIDDEKLMGKTAKPRGPKVQYLYLS